VSEAIYLNDLDENGIELCADRPETDWPRDANGELKMFTAALDVDSLLEEAQS
jgi:catechol 2,3-dioxygenase